MKENFPFCLGGSYERETVKYTIRRIISFQFKILFYRFANMSSTFVMELLLFDTTKRNDSFRSTILSFAAGYGCKDLVKAMI